MSSGATTTTTTTTTAELDVVTVADAVEKAPRRFPAPCWTQEETLALIEAYRERWYSLRRGYLRTADWDAVAAAVASRCPGASPTKTSAQCRHKMEKLRQRYRAEKQRALSSPYPAGRYFSTWFFFENMEAMENGTTPPTVVQKPENSSDESRLKSCLDQNPLKLKLKAKNDAVSSPDLGYHAIIKQKRFNSDYLKSEISNKFEEEIDHGNEVHNFGPRQQPRNGIPKPSFKTKPKIFSKLSNNFDMSGGFNQAEMLPPFKKLGKFNPIMDSDSNRSIPNEEFWVRSPNNNNDHSNNLRAKYWASLNPNSDSRAAIHGLKRRRNAVEEIVESIKLLGEGFVKMEKAKMEMAREIEVVRMEMEMKRNEMLLESQKQIVDACLKGLLEIKKSKKVKTAVVRADSSEQ